MRTVNRHSVKERPKMGQDIQKKDIFRLWDMFVRLWDMFVLCVSVCVCVYQQGKQTARLRANIRTRRVLSWKRKKPKVRVGTCSC